MGVNRQRTSATRLWFAPGSWFRHLPLPGPLWWALSLSLTVLVLLALWYAAGRYRLSIDHQSMVCLNGKTRWFLVDTARGPKDIMQGDLVAFRAAKTGIAALDGQIFIKRAAGVPGDWITVTQAWTAINGTMMTEGLDLVSVLGIDALTLERHERVPSDHFWVLGDTRKSFDSRYWGYVPFERVLGVAYALF